MATSGWARSARNAALRRSPRRKCRSDRCSTSSGPVASAARMSNSSTRSRYQRRSNSIPYATQAAPAAPSPKTVGRSTEG